MLCGESAKSQILDCKETQSPEKAIAIARVVTLAGSPKGLINDEA
jgi:hypothetical protein